MGNKPSNTTAQAFEWKVVVPAIITSSGHGLTASISYPTAIPANLQKNLTQDEWDSTVTVIIDANPAEVVTARNAVCVFGVWFVALIVSMVLENGIAIGVVFCLGFVAFYVVGIRLYSRATITKNNIHGEHLLALNEKVYGPKGLAIGIHQMEEGDEIATHIFVGKPVDAAQNYI